MGNGQADIAAVAALLARHWKENRPYFTLQGIARGAGLNSWWVRRRDRAGLEQHWFRFMPTQSRHCGACTSLPLLAQRGS
jgi:hypothetical protein